MKILADVVITQEFKSVLNKSQLKRLQHAFKTMTPFTFKGQKYIPIKADFDINLGVMEARIELRPWIPRK